MEEFDKTRTILSQAWCKNHRVPGLKQVVEMYIPQVGWETPESLSVLPATPQRLDLSYPPAISLSNSSIVTAGAVVNAIPSSLVSSTEAFIASFMPGKSTMRTTSVSPSRA